MFVGIAATLALASGVAVAAGSLGQGQAKPKVWVSKDGSTAVVSGEGEIVAGLEGDLLEPEVRRLAVLAGHGSQLGVTVRDLDSTLARLVQLGAPVVSTKGPVTLTGGAQKMRIVVVQDFDGHFVELTEPETLPSTPAPTANVLAVRLRLGVNDVETAARLNLPITTIVMNNGVMGGYGRFMPVATERYRANRLSGRYADLAASFGVYSESIKDPEAVASRPASPGEMKDVRYPSSNDKRESAWLSTQTVAHGPLWEGTAAEGAARL